MQEPYKKGVANHLGPESCADGRKVVGEALTGEHAGQPLSSEITTSACRPCPDRGKATSGAALSELPPDAAESETLCMRESSRRENREAPGVPAPIRRGTAGEGHKPYVRHARSWGVGRSHSTDLRGSVLLCRCRNLETPKMRPRSGTAPVTPTCTVTCSDRTGSPICERIAVACHPCTCGIRTSCPP